MHGGLGCVVIGLFLRFVDDEARHGADIDDHAVFLGQHLFAKFAAAPECAVQVDVNDVEPMFIGDGFGRGFGTCDTGIVDQNINAAFTAHFSALVRT